MAGTLYRVKCKGNATERVNRDRKAVESHKHAWDSWHLYCGLHKLEISADNGMTWSEVTV